MVCIARPVTAATLFLPYVREMTRLMRENPADY